MITANLLYNPFKIITSNPASVLDVALMKTVPTPTLEYVLVSHRMPLFPLIPGLESVLKFSFNEVQLWWLGRWLSK